MIRNVHERVVGMSPARAWELAERVAEPDGVLWPVDHWPPMRMDRPLSVGATGGHGPIRYHCTAIEPGERVTFTFDRSLGVDGTHTLLVLPGTRPDTCVVRHELVGKPSLRMAVRWALVVRWLHDALIEELLDRAETAAGQPPAHPVRWSPWVRLIRRIMVHAPGAAPVSR
ncbi:SRPBCC family protein [Labedaea rhizosphaerae]|uniref:Polyketide cyclase/dehydrase/lipid transport protein n=1 Tax=Labedaea rhizosphaerae TaxID=598644 RepID=A0A4R6SC69_LABRH|nr:SRPBCC family protein [Labedaea rhizosphaerae]TDP97204.1 hypothetical protein EV186_103166 [Labedaea rhizosphaerae]